MKSKKRTGVGGMNSALNRLTEDFHDFAWKTNILASTAGFSIGIATKEMIEKVLRRVGYPDAVWAWLARVAPGWFSGPGTNSVVLGILGDVMVWMAVLFMTFVVSYYLLKKFIVVSDKVADVAANVAVPVAKTKEASVPEAEKPYYEVKSSA